MLAWWGYSPAATPPGVYGAAGAPSPMTFTFKLERVNGTPADPPEVRLGLYVWNPGDTLTLGNRSLRVVDVRDQGEDEPVVLVVEDVAG